MVEPARVARVRSVLSEIVYVVLNTLLVISVTVLIIATDHWALSVALVLLSKWRIFAVRPRFWLANIKSNLVDTIVGVSFVFIIFLAGNEAIIARLVLTALYIIWVLIIKPKSSEKMIEAQAATALFLGTTASTLMLYEFSSIFLVIANFTIAYSAVRHVLLFDDDTENIQFIPLVFGLLIAELSWISYHWLIAYRIPATELRIPQLSIIVLLVGFSSLSVYRSHQKHGGQVHFADVIMPIAFSIIIILTIVLAFSGESYHIF